MSEKIQLRRSAVAGRVPTTSQLDLGEIGINTNDGKLYIKKDDGSTTSIVEIGDTSDIETDIDSQPSVVSTGYLFNTSTSGNVASASTVHLNNSAWSSATTLYASVVNSNGKRVDAQAEEYLQPGAIILLQNMKGTGASHLKARVTSASFTSTTITIGLTSVVTSGSTPNSLDNVSLGVITTTNAYSIEQALGFDVDDATGVGAFTTDELTDNATLKATLETLGAKAKLLREGLGVSVGDTDLGTFAGNTIEDNQSVKAALRDLEKGIERGPVSVNATRYKFSTATGSGPGSGRLRYNNSTLGSVTTIYLHEEDRDGRDAKVFFDDMLKQGATIYVTNGNNSADLLKADLASDATYDTNYYTLSLTNVEVSGAIPTADDGLTFGLANIPAETLEPFSGYAEVDFSFNTASDQVQVNDTYLTFSIVTGSASSTGLASVVSGDSIEVTWATGVETFSGVSAPLFQATQNYDLQAFTYTARTVGVNKLAETADAKHIKVSAGIVGDYSTFSGDYDDLTNLPTIPPLDTAGISTTISTASLTTNTGSTTSISGSDCPVQLTDYTDGYLYISLSGSPTSNTTAFLTAVNSGADAASSGSPFALTVNDGTSYTYQITGRDGTEFYYSSVSPVAYFDGDGISSMTYGSPTTYDVTITGSNNPIFDSAEAVTIDGVEYASGVWVVTNSSATASDLAADPGLAAGDTIVQVPSLSYSVNGHTDVKLANFSDLGNYNNASLFDFSSSGELTAKDLRVKDDIVLGAVGANNDHIISARLGNGSAFSIRAIDGNDNVENMIQCYNDNTGVKLYTNDVLKLQTTTSGCTVTGTVTETSDARLKKDVVIIDSALDKVSELNGVTFKWISDDIASAGVIAQDVEKVLPMLVETSAEDEMKSVSYSGLIGLLVESVKELKAEIDDLKSRQS
jgi:hypothetical protein